MATKINNHLHVSDEANSVKIDKTKTIWKDDPKITNLQNALETIGEWAKDSGFATEDKFGVVRLAKDSEFTAEKGDGVVNVTKLIKFNERPYATETKHGTSRYATLAEGITENSNVKDKIITPYILDQKFNKTTSNYNRFGTVKLANEQMAKVGNDKTRYMTPYLTKLAIDSLVPNVAVATEKVSGTVKLASLTDMKNGTAREGVAVSPYAFVKTIANNTNVGVVKLANANELKTRTTNNAVTPVILKPYLDKIDNLEGQLKELEKKIMDQVKPSTVPIGTVIASYTDKPLGAGWIVLNKATIQITKAKYPELFEVLSKSLPVSNNSVTLTGTNGKVLRGKNYGQYGNVVEQNLNTYQADATQRMVGHFGGKGLVVVGSMYAGGPFKTNPARWNDARSASNHEYSSRFDFDNSRSVRTASEERVKSLTVVHQIYAGR